MSATAAFPHLIVFEKLNFRAALRAVGFKNSVGFPILHILSGTFHNSLLKGLNFHNLAGLYLTNRSIALTYVKEKIYW